MIDEWQIIQEKYASILGDRGISLRRKYYKKFFFHFGENVVIRENVYISTPEKIYIGDNVKINRECMIYGSGGIWVGDYVLIGPGTFIHSANHDIEWSSKFFFEGGYIYKPVKIAENCLISAKCIILPGAYVDTSSFLGAGAVVTGKQYVTGSYLFGNPAVHIESAKKGKSYPWEPNYKIVLLVPNNSIHKRLAEIFIGSLGLPQVGIYSIDEKIPNNCKIIIVWGDISWARSVKKSTLFLSKRDVQFWFPDKASYNTEGAIKVLINHQQCLDFSKHLVHQFVPSKSKQKSRENIRTLSTYYALKFLQKSSLVTFNDCIYGLLLAHVVLKNDFFVGKALVDSVKENEEYNEIFCHLKIISMQNANTLQDGIVQFFYMLLDEYNNKSMKLDEDVLILLLLFLDIVVKKGNAENLLENPHLKYKFVLQRIKKDNKSKILCYYGIISKLLGFSELKNLVHQRLFNELYDDQACYIKSFVDGKSYYYSPLLPLFYSLEEDGQEVNSSPIYHIELQKYDWNLFSKPSTKQQKFQFKDLFDFNHLNFSQSLIDNLLKMLTVPSVPNGYQYELSLEQYNCDFLNIQRIWTEFFKKISHKLGENLVVLSPWPKDKSFALSLRYDVDRPLTLQMIQDIISIQKEYTDSPCATWFFFKNSTQIEKQTYLRTFFQEIGLHALGDEDQVDNLNQGITFHSGPTSTYWRGLDSISHLNEDAYAELLSMQSGKPLPFLSPKVFNELWALPLHFPMENSTKKVAEKNYFHTFLTPLKAVKEANGHIILASHPDIEQGHTVDILKTFDKKEGWFSSIQNVVHRCKKILCYGNFYITENEGKIFLCSKYSISDLQVKIFKNEDVVSRKILQINAFQPREF